MNTLAPRISTVRRSPLFLVNAFAFLVIAGMLFAGSARAQVAPADAGWYCWVAGGHRPSVRCVQSEAANQPDPSTADAWDLVRTESGAIDTVRMRQMVMTNPAAFAHDVTVIPLYLPPQDTNRLMLLLDTLMCYGMAGCRIALL